MLRDACCLYTNIALWMKFEGRTVWKAAMRCLRQSAYKIFGQTLV